MEKSLVLILALTLVLLASCTAKEVPGNNTDTTAVTDAATQPITAPAGTDVSDDTASSGEPDASGLRDLAEAALKAAAFDAEPGLVFKDDDYSEDLLMFSYGVEENTDAVTDFVLSETPSRSANTVAYLVFADGTSADVIASVRSQIENVYVNGLRESLKNYNPEAFALCDKAVFKEYDNALLLVISENPDAVVAAVESVK